MKWQPISAQLQAVYSVDIDPWGRFIAASRGGGMSIYDMAVRDHVAADATCHCRIPNEVFPAPVAHRDYVHAAAFHPSGNLLATSGYREVKLWSGYGELLSTIALPADTHAWSANEDGSQLAVATSAPGIVLLNARSGETRIQVDTAGQPVTVLQMIPGPRPLVIAVLGDMRILTAVAETGEVLSRTEPLASGTTAFSSLLAEQRLAALSTDGVVRLFSIAPDTGVIASLSEIKSEIGPVQKLAGEGVHWSLLRRIAESSSGRQQTERRLVGPICLRIVYRLR